MDQLLTSFVGLSDVPLRKHLIPTIKRWNDNGTRNDIDNESSKIDEDSDSPSQTSEVHREPSPALILSRVQTKSTSPSTQEVDEEESSSLNATIGGNGSIHSADIDDKRSISDHGNNSTQFSPLKIDFPARKRGHSRAASENSGKKTTPPTPIISFT